MGRPATGETKPRAIRIPEDLWQSALKVAQARGEPLSEVVRECLTEYVASSGTRSGKRNRRVDPERVAAQEPPEAP